jgi:hypothetical protein
MVYLQISLKFYQRRLVKTLFLTSKEDKIVWEHWSVPVQLRNWIPKVYSTLGISENNLRIISPLVVVGQVLPARIVGAYIPAHPMVKFEVELLLKDRFLQILHLVNESKHHLPPVPGPAQPPLYPVDVRATFLPTSPI